MTKNRKSFSRHERAARIASRLAVAAFLRHLSSCQRLRFGLPALPSCRSLLPAPAPLPARPAAPRMGCVASQPAAVVDAPAAAPPPRPVRLLAVGLAAAGAFDALFPPGSGSCASRGGALGRVGGAGPPVSLRDACATPPADWPALAASVEALLWVTVNGDALARVQQEELDRLLSRVPSLPLVMVGRRGAASALDAERAPGGLRAVYAADSAGEGLQIAVAAALAPNGRVPGAAGPG